MRDRLEIAGMARLAWPATLSFLSFGLMEVVDCAMLGMVNLDAVAGAALAATGLYLIMAFPINMLRAINPVSSRWLGQKLCGLEATAPFGGLVRLIVISSVGMGAIATLGTLGASAGLDLLNYDPALAQAMKTFLLWRSFFIPFDLLFLGGWSLLEGLNDTRSPMIAGVVSNAANVLFALVLIPGHGPIPALGVTGAALASNLATLVGLAVIGWALHRRANSLNTRGASDNTKPVLANQTRCFSSRYLGIEGGIFKSFVRIGWPMGVTGLLDIAGTLILGMMIAKISAAASATHGIVSKLLTLGLASASGLAVATVSLVARALGAKSTSLVYQRARLALLIQLILGTLIGFIAIAFRNVWPIWFTNSPEVVESTLDILPLFMIILWIDGLLYVLAGILEGLGNTRILLMATICFDLALAGTVFILLGSKATLHLFYQIWAIKSLCKLGLLLGALLWRIPAEPLIEDQPRTITSRLAYSFQKSLGPAPKDPLDRPRNWTICWRWWSRPLPDG